MDFSSIGFLFVIVAVGGAAGYVGDHLGKKLGKKRLSLWGLRPRHTAAVSTVAFGMFLSLLTIFLVLIISAPVRQWILHGSQALAELKQIRVELEETKPKLDIAKREYESTLSQEHSLQGQIKVDQSTERFQQAEILRQKTEIARFQGSIRKVTAEISLKNARLDIDRRRLDANRLQLSKITADLRQVQVAKKQTEVEAESIFRKNSDLETKNSTLTKSIAVQKGDLEALRTQIAELDKTKDGLTAEVEHDRSDLAMLKSNLNEMQIKLSDITEKFTSANHAAAQFAENNNYLQKDFIETRLQPLIYARFEEITRLTVEPDLNDREAEDAISSLVSMADAEAQRRGAMAQGTFKAADIIDRPDGTTADQIKKLLRNKLVGNAKPMALIAVASFNFYKNEPIAIDVSLKPNPLVYRRGEVMKQTDLDGAASDSEIIRALTAFGVSLRDKAQKDQMIPRSNGEPFGSVSADQVYSLVRSVKQAGKIVHLQAIVESDTHAADPLRLDFKIK